MSSGATLRQLAAHRGRAQLFGFDSFQGLPEAWRTHKIGDYAAPAPKVEGATLVPGLFEETLPRFAFASGQVTFVHVDCDLYSSTCTVLEAIRPHLARGAIVTFDELLDYPGHEAHELLALGEAFDAGMRFDWLARGDKPFDQERAAILVW